MPHEEWWDYVKKIIRAYPELERKANSTCASANSLTKKEQRRYDAVKAAMEETLRMRQGASRIEVIRKVYWDNSHTLFGAGLCVPISERMAYAWNADFIRAVEKNLDLP